MQKLAGSDDDSDDAMDVDEDDSSSDGADRIK